MNELGYKIVLIGDVGVGKSSLLAWLMNDKKPIQPTVGAAYAVKNIRIGNYETKLSIWDTAGQERFRSLGPIYYRNSLGCMCVFDITNNQSFKNLKQWLDSYKYFDSNENKKIIIVANKCDYSMSEWCIGEDGIKMFAEENSCDYILTDCINGKNVNMAFTRLAESIYHMKTGPIIPDTIIPSTNKYQIIEFAEKNLPSKIPFTSISCL